MIQRIFLIQLLVALHYRITSQCPSGAANWDDQITDDGKLEPLSDIDKTDSNVITLDTIKKKLKTSGVFDFNDPEVMNRHKKEMTKLFDSIEIATTSRNRQPAMVQNMFSSLRMVERIVKKQLKDGLITTGFADQFKWDKLFDNVNEQPQKKIVKRM